MKQSNKKLKILQISTSDIGGGAAKVAWDLFKAYQKLGHDSWMSVGNKKSTEEYIKEIPRINRKYPFSVPSQLELKEDEIIHFRKHQVVHWIKSIAGLLPKITHRLGREFFDFPGSHYFLNLFPYNPDIIHAHNLHGHFFDINYLIRISNLYPVIMTCHDEWLFTGHCAYTFSCNRWEYGCGDCPDLSIYPSIPRDATHFNYRRKEEIYHQSKLYIATPSAWLMDRVERSILKPIEARIIPYGIDLSIFKPDVKEKSRGKLNLPNDELILLFVADNLIKNPFKDYKFLRKAINNLNLYEKKIRFILLGGSSQTEIIGNITLQHIPYISNPEVVANYYQSADIFLHAAKADNFPNTILEASACGTPVIATAVGGIPEQINHGVTGFLVTQGESEELSNFVRILFKNENLRMKMGKNASKLAKEKYDLTIQVGQYLSWYHEITNSRGNF